MVDGNDMRASSQSESRGLSLDVGSRFGQSESYKQATFTALSQYHFNEFVRALMGDFKLHSIIN